MDTGEAREGREEESGMNRGFLSRVRSCGIGLEEENGDFLLYNWESLWEDRELLRRRLLVRAYTLGK